MEDLIVYLKESFEKYYGLDWLGMFLTFYCIKFLKDKKRFGFILGVIASLVWLVFNFLAGSIAGIIANLCFTYMYAKGFLVWLEDSKREFN